MVRRRGSLVSIYDLCKPLSVKDKEELRVVLSELQKLVKDKNVSMIFGKTDYRKKRLEPLRYYH